MGVSRYGSDTLRPSEVPSLTFGETKLLDGVGLKPMVRHLCFASTCDPSSDDLQGLLWGIRADNPKGGSALTHDQNICTNANDEMLHPTNMRPIS